MDQLHLKSFFYTGKTEKPVQGGEFTAMINPNNISHKVGVNYNEIAVPGSIKPQLQFTNIQNETLDFNLIFDGTGLIDKKYDSDNLQKQIKLFKQVTYGYDGDHHEVGYIKLTWGNLIMDCRLTSLTLKYTLFDTKGKPLRAEATCSFKETTTTNMEKELMKKSSPDLTHIKVVKAGYGLRHMCYEIYGDAKLDVTVAKFNGFTSRYVPLGTEVILPPLQTL